MSTQQTSMTKKILLFCHHKVAYSVPRQRVYHNYNEEGIITTLYTSVKERVKEIGTMKAIGAKNKFILTLFLSEALLIGLLGPTSGILIGIGGAYALSSIAPHTNPGGGGTVQSVGEGMG
jgi:hypothetical protein